MNLQVIATLRPIVIRRAALTCALCLALIGPLLTPAGPTPATAAQRPSLVLIVTDDQRWDATFAMPVLQRRLVDRGVTFTNGFVVNPLCCPSRASILTGQYSHSTGVYDNGGPFGGFRVFDDSSTIATWLDDSGYSTALVGKYINGYNRQHSTYIPPGWDRWVTFAKSGYNNYTLAIDGRTREFGSFPEDYSTDVFAARATSFIRKTSGPLFLYWSPKAPHAPSTPAPRHRLAFRGLQPSRPPNYNELDMTDKPAWLQGWPEWTDDKARRTDRQRKQMLRSLLSVDDGIDRIMDALRETGRLENTMIAFVSDNGFTLGEHRLNGKQTPYEESVRVPYIVRYDPLVNPGTIENRLVANIDLAPTFAAVAGVPAPDAEGRNLNRLFSSARRWREDLLIEHHGELVPTFCQVRNVGYSYVRYTTGEEELYNMRTDRYQLDNVVGSTSSGATLEAMRARVRELCDPPPPGFIIE
ncbi:MAG: sulfatase [Actinomycetota bacterium]|nr:sulfatase [Actinomycetota bacterium]